MKLKKFNEKNNKRTSIIIFTITCILLVSGVILYRTFAIFEVRTNQNVIKGTVQDPGNIYFAFYVNNEIQKDMPSQNSEYVLDEEASYCGVNGSKEANIKVTLTENYVIQVHGVTTSRTKCNLYFVKGKFIQGKGIPIVEDGDGLYEVEHEDYTGEETGWKTTELRFAGKKPKNYIEFNGEVWRIIGLVNVMTGSGTIEQRLKIIKSESIGDYSWDKETFTTTNWNDSALNTMLNDGYYSSQDQVVCYTGENNKESSKSTCSFLSNGLSELSRNMIDGNIRWNIGAGTDQNANERASQFYMDERAIASNTLNVGLLNPSDYGYATSGGENGRTSCLENYLYKYNGECSNNDWLWLGITISGKVEWTLTSVAPRNAVYYITNVGWVHIRNRNVAAIVRPTVYLKTNVKIMNDGQDGSVDKPYHLQQIL